MRLRGGAGGGGAGGGGLSLAICMMSSMQEGNGGLMGNHCAGLMGKVKLLPRKNLERGTHISTETNRSGAQPMSAPFLEETDQ